MAERPRSPLDWVVRSGVLLLLVAVVVVPLFPLTMGPLPSGMRTPIIAFELARSEAEIEAMFGAAGSRERARWVSEMDRGNTVDFAFMLAYGAFLVLLARFLRISGSRAARCAELLAPIAPIADALENTRLFAITGSLGHLSPRTMEQLQVFTWTKWGSLALVLALCAPGLVRRGMVGGVALVPALLSPWITAFAFMWRGVWAELMNLSVVLAVLGALLVAVRERRALSTSFLLTKVAKT